MIGEIFESASSGKFIVLEKLKSGRYVVEFLDTGYRTTGQGNQLRIGNINDKLSPSVFGVGVLGDKYPATSGGKHLRQYLIWSNMLGRCYSNPTDDRHRTYRDCQVSEGFKSYTNFYEWCGDQFGFEMADYHFDKDILVKGNRVYSEDRCVFVPREINNLFTSRVNHRGNCPLGVYEKSAGRFAAQISSYKGPRVHLGCFDTSEEAFLAYKVAKERHIKEVAEKWFGKVDNRVYEALMGWEVEITD